MQKIKIQENINKVMKDNRKYLADKGWFKLDNLKLNLPENLLYSLFFTL